MVLHVSESYWCMLCLLYGITAFSFYLAVIAWNLRRTLHCPYVGTSFNF